MRPFVYRFFSGFLPPFKDMHISLITHWCECECLFVPNLFSTCAGCFKVLYKYSWTGLHWIVSITQTCCRLKTWCLPRLSSAGGELQHSCDTQTLVGLTVWKYTLFFRTSLQILFFSVIIWEIHRNEVTSNAPATYSDIYMKTWTVKAEQKAFKGLCISCRVVAAQPEWRQLFC